MLRRVITGWWRGGGAADRGSYTTELLFGIVVAVGIATVVGAILTQHFTSAAEGLDLGLTP